MSHLKDKKWYKNSAPNFTFIAFSIPDSSVKKKNQPNHIEKDSAETPLNISTTANSKLIQKR